MSSGTLSSTLDAKTVDLIEGLVPEKRGIARVWHGISTFVRRKPLGAIGAVLLFALVGFAACYVPTWRASRINALEALRYE